MEQAVIIKFRYYYDTLDELHRLEDLIENLLVKEEVGEYDGYEISHINNEVTLFFYGSDSNKIWQILKPFFEGKEYFKGANVLLRYGPPEPGVDQLWFILSDN